MLLSWHAGRAVWSDAGGTSNSAARAATGDERRHRSRRMQVSRFHLLGLIHIASSPSFSFPFSSSPFSCLSLSRRILSRHGGSCLYPTPLPFLPSPTMDGRPVRDADVGCRPSARTSPHPWWAPRNLPLPQLLLRRLPPSPATSPVLLVVLQRRVPVQPIPRSRPTSPSASSESTVLEMQQLAFDEAHGGRFCLSSAQFFFLTGVKVYSCCV